MHALTHLTVTMNKNTNWKKHKHMYSLPLRSIHVHGILKGVQRNQYALESWNLTMFWNSFADLLFVNSALVKCGNAYTPSRGEGRRNRLLPWRLSLCQPGTWIGLERHWLAQSAKWYLLDNLWRKSTWVLCFAGYQLRLDGRTKSRLYNAPMILITV